MKDILTLIDAICETYDDKSLQPKDGVTYCNFAVRQIAEKMGYTGFKGLLANDIIETMSYSVDWTKATGGQAQGMANEGYLVVAGLKAKPHGHIAVIRPGKMLYSNKLKMFVPRCINIGKDVFIGRMNNHPAGINFAFQKMPDFFVYQS